MDQDYKEMNIKVEGITCAGCAMDMENILMGKQGIMDATVSYRDGTVNVKYDPQKIEDKKVFYNVRKLGFKAKKI